MAAPVADGVSMRSILFSALAAALLTGCGSSAFPGFSDPGKKRLDVLTSFTLALSKRDFLEAAAYLAPADRAKLADDAGILPQYRERVRAIRRATLMNNPLVEVRHGLISGIPDILPVLAVGGTEEAFPANEDRAEMESSAPDSRLTPASDSIGAGN
jgi:hypothetical protein